MRLRLPATLILALCTRALLGQEPTTPTPTFRARVDLVELDVRVTDGNGAFVPGLTANDFAVFEDGQPQTIAAVSVVDIPIVSAESAPALQLVQPDVQTNATEESRLYVIAFDEGITSEQILRARLFLRRFVTRYFGPNDTAAVVWVGRGVAGHTQDFTSSQRLLLESIDRFQGGPSAEPPPTPLVTQGGPLSSPGFTGSSLPITLPSPTVEQGSAARTRMSSLKALAEFMAGMRGRRKALLYVSTGLGFDMYDVLDYQGGVMSLALADAHAAMTAATRGNVTIYAIDPRGLSADGALGDRETAVSPVEFAGLGQSRRSLRAFAEVTGGFAFTDQNDFDGAFRRIMQENSSYYVLGFSSTNQRRDGRFRKLEVRVKRPGLSVQSRVGYVAPSGRAPAAKPRSSGNLAPAVADALASPLRMPGLPMKTVAASYKASGRDADIVLVLEVDATMLDLIEKGGEHTGSVDVAWAAISADGRKTPNGRYRSRLALRPDTYDRASRHGLRFVSGFSLPPGRYQLRVAAGGLTGIAGSVTSDLEVPDFTAAPLALSGLSLTSKEAGDVVTHVVANRLQGALPAPPSALRDFATGDVIALYAEAYPGKKTPKDAIDVTVVLQDGNGKVLRTLGAKRSAAIADRVGGSGFVAEVALDDVPSGGYVLRVEARAGVRDGASVSREIPIRVR